jgi:hypothetical protein
MIKTSPFAGFVPFRNGGSVPSIGGAPTLVVALAAVERAEEMLKAARTVARAAARREGESVDGLFSESFFIKRSTAEAWSDRARRAGEKAMIAIFGRTVSMDAADVDSPFYFLAKRLNQPGALRAQQAEAAALEAQKLAEQILAAARRARTSGDGERPLPAPDSVAGRILAAGARRRTPTGGHQDD